MRHEIIAAGCYCPVGRGLVRLLASMVGLHLVSHVYSSVAGRSCLSRPTPADGEKTTLDGMRVGRAARG